jgi:dCMP deaminase
MTRLSWDQYALNLAHAAATRSEDPYHQVGVALMRPDHTVAAVGYNGAPSGVDIDWSDRDARRAQVIHAEANALRYVRPGEVGTLVTTMMPCANCVLLMSSYGIRRVVYTGELDPAVYDTTFIRELANECGIEIVKERA